VLSGQANVGGSNNAVTDPSGGNSAKPVSPPPRGTNSAGTAESAGPSLNTQPGVTTGAANGSSASTDAAIAAENRTIDRKLNSICRGC
jgi:hypothetical protein